MQQKRQFDTSATVPLLHDSNDLCSDACSIWLRRHFGETSLQTYLFVTLLFGVVTGLLAAFYNVCFQTMLQLIWGIQGEEPHGWFEHGMMDLPSSSTSIFKPLLKTCAGWLSVAIDDIGFVHILFISTLFATCAGMIQKFLGFPGDLPNTICHVHKMEAVPIRQLPTMFLCSLCTIVSGGSLGPEAPLLAMCASTTGWISEKVLGHKGRLLRDCTLIGMASGLAAFFGVGLGGALFAFEVAHRTGLQFFEALPFGVSAGMVTLLVFRGTLGLKFGPIWEFDDSESNKTEMQHFLACILMGVIMAVVAIMFIKQHRLINKLLLASNLQEHRTPVKSGFLGGLLIGVIGIFLPPTLFWSEFEINNMANSSHVLTHVWPQGGFWGMNLMSGGHYEGWLFLLIGFFKLSAISITVLSGLRGGFIFPLMFAGAAFARAVLSIPHLPILSDQSIVLMTMAGAAGLNASITRTPFATSLILTSLSGHLEILPPILCTALIAFFITMPFEFIKTQQYRSDILSVETVLKQDVVMHQGQMCRPVMHRESSRIPAETVLHFASDNEASHTEVITETLTNGAGSSTDLNG